MRQALVIVLCSLYDTASLLAAFEVVFRKKQCAVSVLFEALPFDVSVVQVVSCFLRLVVV